MTTCCDPRGMFVAVLVLVACGGGAAKTAPLDDLRPLVVTGTWVERRPDASGDVVPVEVTGEIWTAAFQRRIDETKRLEIPARGDPYYLDGPLVLPSGTMLVAEPRAEIRLVPGTGTCLVRNEHVVGFGDRPVQADCQPDTDITIEGGVWTTLATAPGESNGNTRGHSSRQEPVPGCHGVILLHNVRRVTVRDVTIRESRPFGVHLGNVRDFTVDGVTLDRQGRDGVHVDGPASAGIIRRVHGDSRDDPVSLTAWDWRQYSATFGPISDIVVEEITGAPEDRPGTDAIRLLPGVKRFPDGALLDCPISNIVLRRITDIREFKLYDQPNLEVPAGTDQSERVGRLENIRFEQLLFRRPGTIEVHADTDGLVIEGVTLACDVPDTWHLLAIGPKSQTYRPHETDPSTWREIFSPDRDCTVRNVRIAGVRLAGVDRDLPLDRLVTMIEQRPNADYPRTTPKGGTGRGHWVR